MILEYNMPEIISINDDQHEQVRGLSIRTADEPTTSYGVAGGTLPHYTQHASKPVPGRATELQSLLPSFLVSTQPLQNQDRNKTLLTDQLYTVLNFPDAPREIESLISRGADPHANRNGHNLLVTALLQKRLTIAEHLINRKVDLKSKDESGFSPLMAAVSGYMSSGTDKIEYRDIIKQLAKAGVGMELSDDDTLRMTFRSANYRPDDCIIALRNVLSEMNIEKAQEVSMKQIRGPAITMDDPVSEARREFDKELLPLVNKIKNLEQRYRIAVINQDIEKMPLLQEALETAKTLLTNLQQEGDNYYNVNANEDTLNHFKDNCVRHIENSRLVLEQHRNDWSELLTNLALAVCTAGIGLLIKGIANLAKGEDFHVQTDSAKVIR